MSRTGPLASALSVTYRYSLSDCLCLAEVTRIWRAFGSRLRADRAIRNFWSSLYDIVPQQSVEVGNFTSVTLRREQPLTGGLKLNLGLNRTWYRTPAGNHRRTGLLAGVSVANPSS
jgi:hypothetical protein